MGWGWEGEGVCTDGLDPALEPTQGEQATQDSEKEVERKFLRTQLEDRRLDPMSTLNPRASQALVAVALGTPCS